MIDHTLLKPEADEASIRKLCEDALEFGFHSVCVNPFWTAYCMKLLSGRGVTVCTVIGFPLGATTTSTKCQEAEETISNGAREIDMVMNIGALKSGLSSVVAADIRSVVDRAKSAADALVKVIVEAPLLSNEEKLVACEICKDSGADFVKTCTGFGSTRATVRDVSLLREAVGQNLGVKAAGGIRTYRQAMAMVRAGATRIGTSQSIAILRDLETRAPRLTRRRRV
jgi:deoxyribose-phosphate aldolase